MRSGFNFFIAILPCIFVGALFGLGWYFVFHPEMKVRNKFHGTNSAAIPGIILVVGMGFGLFFAAEEDRMAEDRKGRAGDKRDIFPAGAGALAYPGD